MLSSEAPSREPLGPVWAGVEAGEARSTPPCRHAIALAAPTGLPVAHALRRCHSANTTTASPDAAQVAPAHFAGFIVRSFNARRESARPAPPSATQGMFIVYISHCLRPSINAQSVTHHPAGPQGQLAFRFYLAALGSSKDDERDAAAGVDAARVRLRAAPDERALAARVQDALRGALAAPPRSATLRSRTERPP